MLKLYSYWRSSSAYRVRIALNLKALPHQIVPVHLVRDGGEQHLAHGPADEPPELLHALLQGISSFYR